ncbi:hypothetical protein M8494_25915 [Serratia ureilytica]
MIDTAVRYIAPLGGLRRQTRHPPPATSTSETFEVRLYPPQPVDGLRPGMATPPMEK